MATFVVIPTFNEAGNLPNLVGELLSLPLRLRVVVVDDGSPDGTGQLADALAEAYPERLSVIHRPHKMGLGTAYLTGFRHALADENAEGVLTMDADFSHHPRHIPEMVDLGAHCALVIGSRYVAGGGTAGSPILRRLLSRGANAFARGLLGLHARDATAGFRLYRREVLETIPLDSIFSSGYSFLIEMLYLVQRGGWTVGETPILFRDRREGRSKISQAEILKALYTVLRLAWRRLKARVTAPRSARRPAGPAPRVQ